MSRIARPPAERFWPRVVKTDGCWLWTGAASGSGYGHFDIGGRAITVHRWAYEQLVGPIPAGLILDHLCRVRRCVNPAHLEPVTNRENILRGTAPTAVNARASHCIHGHELTAENTYYIGGSRRCRTCMRAKDHARWRRRAKERLALAEAGNA